MTETDVFERRFQAAVREYVADVTTHIDPADLARRIATTEPRRRGLRAILALRAVAVPNVAWLYWILLLALLLAAVAGSAIVGSRLLKSTDSRLELNRVPAEFAVPSGLLEGTRLLAISYDELWATGSDAWHFQDGVWAAESIDPIHLGEGVAGMAVASDGTIWAVGGRGVAYRRDGQWVVVDDHPADLVTVDLDGTVWVEGAESACDIWALRLTGSEWTRTRAAACPETLTQGGAVFSIAVDGRGTIWAGGAGFVANALASYADGRWRTYETVAELRNMAQVNVLGVAPNGDLWIVFQHPDRNGHEASAARFDGAGWSVVELPDGVMNRNVTLAPDGTLWTYLLFAREPDLARYLGGQWTYPFADLESDPGALAVAPDGTVFGLGERLIRLPTPDM